MDNPRGDGARGPAGAGALPDAALEAAAAVDAAIQVPAEQAQALREAAEQAAAALAAEPAMPNLVPQVSRLLYINASICPNAPNVCLDGNGNGRRQAGH